MWRMSVIEPTKRVLTVANRITAVGAKQTIDQRRRLSGKGPISVKQEPRGYQGRQVQDQRVKQGPGPGRILIMASALAMSAAVRAKASWPSRRSPL